MRISIVIPVLHEEDALPRCLAACNAQEPPYEIIVADGGSTDRTVDIARMAGARVVRSQAGRALQMNSGARFATGGVILFLHADSLLPPGALCEVRRAVQRGADAGAFRLLYDRSGLHYLLAALLSDLYCRATGDLFGDRAIFSTRETFEAMQGYRHLSLMEDLDLTVRIRRAGLRAVLLRLAVISSARRYEKMGILRGGWWAWKLCRAFHRSKDYDVKAAEFYAVLRR